MDGAGNAGLNLFESRVLLELFDDKKALHFA
jgi:hypothetical protein